MPVPKSTNVISLDAEAVIPSLEGEAEIPSLDGEAKIPKPMPPESQAMADASMDCNMFTESQVSEGFYKPDVSNRRSKVSVAFDKMDEAEQDDVARIIDQLRNTGTRQSVMDYIETIQSRSGGMDSQMSEIVKDLAVESKTREKDKLLWKKRAYKAVIGGIVCVVLAIAVQFSVNYFVNELTKETVVDDSGYLLSKDGSVVQTRSSEMEIDGSGVLVKKNSVNAPLGSGASSAGPLNRRLQTDDQGSAVATRLARQKLVLHSALPDSFFDALDEITIHSDKGHKLNLKIHGFARVPVLNSRCGNVLHIFTAVSGKITLDSYDLSFSGGLETLFANAGFELVVGSAAGRRLSGIASISGFFNHIQQMASEGSWKCGDVPLPITPQFSFQNFTMYQPCGAADATGTKHHVDNCDSMYGGELPGATTLPKKHVHATLGVLGALKHQIGHDVEDPSGIFYMGWNVVDMRAPSYRVKRTTSSNHPLQEKVYVMDKKRKQGVTFQMLHFNKELDRLRLNRLNNSQDATKSFCEPVNNTGDHTLKQMEGEEAKVEGKQHFEFFGLEEEDGVMYRHWRLLPAKDMLAWLSANSTSSQFKYKSDARFEYWDKADTLEPYRLLTPDGSLVLYHEFRGGLTDTEVEVFLKSTGVHNTTCTPFETRAASFTFGDLPDVSTAFGELQPPEVDFYTNLLYAQDNVDKDTDITSTSMKAVAYPWLNLIGKQSPQHAFAQYARKSKSLFAMYDACAEACAAELASTKAYVQANGQDKLCQAPSLDDLLRCFTNLPQKVGRQCAHSPFIGTFQKVCGHVGRRMAATHGTRQLPDGTQVIDLASLGADEKSRLGQLLEEWDPRFADLTDGQFLFNVSDTGKTQTGLIRKVDHTGRQLLARRLGLCTSVNAAWTTIKSGALCFSFDLPFGCKDEKCRFELEVVITPAAASDPDSAWQIEVKASGQARHPEESAIGCTMSAWGMIGASAEPTCDSIPFTLYGEVGVGLDCGLELSLFSYSGLSLDITVGAETTKWDGGWHYMWWGSWYYFPPFCEVEIYTKAELWVASVFQLWIKFGYEIRQRHHYVKAGAELHIDTSWWSTYDWVKEWTIQDEYHR